MFQKAFIGIDPGLSGAIVFFEDGRLSIYDMPTLALARNGKQRRELDLHELAAILRRAPGNAVAIVEQVGSMPGQGVSSTFAFGKAYGAVLGSLHALQVPVRPALPQIWRRWAGLKAGSGKDAGRARAMELFPSFAAHFSRVKDNGRADAALLAAFGLDTDKLWSHLAA